MSKTLKKRPEDYPQFAFRIDHETKLELSKRIDRLEKLMNRDLDQDEKKVRKNDIVIRALEIGLKYLEGGGSKK